MALVNGKSALVTILSTDQTLDVLQAVGWRSYAAWPQYFQVATAIGIPAELTFFFGLFLMNDPEGRDIVRQFAHVMLRGHMNGTRLHASECPFIALSRAAPHQYLQVRTILRLGHILPIRSCGARSSTGRWRDHCLRMRRAGSCSTSTPSRTLPQASSACLTTVRVASTAPV